MFHLALHFIVPFIVAKLAFASQWQRAFMIMITTMLVDFDHLLANPIYDPSRCSIGFHPLHHPYAIAVYGILCLFPKTRLIGLGLCIHMALDSIDCQFTNGVWLHQTSSFVSHDGQL